MSSPPAYTRSPRPRRPSSSLSSNPTARLAAAQAAAAASPSPPSSPRPGGGRIIPVDGAATVADEDDEAAADDDDESGRPPSPDLPLTMTASAILSQLPRDATAALAEAGTFPPDMKVVVRLRPVGGSAPPLPKTDLRRISASHRFEVVVASIRRALKVAPTDSVFLYVNQTFAPALDEIVGNLHRCFKDSSGQLNVFYSMTPAFG